MSTAAEKEELRKDLSEMRYATQDWVRKVSGFTDRGDPSAYDWTVGNFTTDGTWRDLNCSSVVPAGAKAIVFHVVLKDDAAGSFFQLRKNGNTDVYVVSLRYTQVANVTCGYDMICACDSGRVVEYQTTNTTWTTISVVIKGWWT